MKVWVSKYALTKGLLEVDAEILNDSVVRIGPWDYLHSSNQWHRTREGAVARAEMMREAKIASLRKQLARLEAMRFDT